MDFAALLYLGVGLALIVYLSPALLAARSSLGFPAVSFVGGIPVAVGGIYYFTAASLVVAGLAAHFRRTTVLPSVILAVAGLAGFEFLYGVAFALSTRRFDLLVPRAGLPATGWAGFGTWLIVELVVTSVALLFWDRAGLDRTTVAVGFLFLVSLTLWGVVLDWRYPPFDNSAAVFLVNTLAEVTGALLVPLVFTCRAATNRDLVRRLWGRVTADRTSAAG